MVWIIIGFLILALIWKMLEQGLQSIVDERKQRKEEEKKQQEEETKRSIEQERIRRAYEAAEKDPDLYKRQWEKRINELNIDLSKAERIKAYPLYTKENPNKGTYLYQYFWAEEGAIASFIDYKDMSTPINAANPPSKWEVIHTELLEIEGVYTRNDVTILQYKTGYNIWFAAEDGDKLKAVYKKAKEMSE